MSDNSFDALSKMAAEKVTRRQTLRGLAAVLGGALLTGVGARSAFATPRFCTVCTCGRGTVCNQQHGSRCCLEGAGADCTSVCSPHPVCGSATVHCPQGCGSNGVPAAC
jgi:hypothetical protein